MMSSQVLSSFNVSYIVNVEELQSFLRTELYRLITGAEEDFHTLPVKISQNLNKPRCGIAKKKSNVAHVDVVYRFVWALIISTALCTIKQSKVFLHCSWVHVWHVSFFLFFLKCITDQRKFPHLHLGCVLVVSSSCCFLAANFTGSGVKSRNCPLSSQMVTFVLFREWVMDSPTWGNKLWSGKEAGRTNLTGLLVRDTRRDSRQWNSFSSVMPERSSWTYSWDESVNSCLLFLSPPCERNRTEELPRRRLQQTMLVWMEMFLHRYKSC